MAFLVTLTLEFVWKPGARYQLGELSDIVVRFSESITCFTLSPINSKVMDHLDQIPENPNIQLMSVDVFSYQIEF